MLDHTKGEQKSAAREQVSVNSSQSVESHFRRRIDGSENVGAERRISLIQSLQLLDPLRMLIDPIGSRHQICGWASTPQNSDIPPSTISSAARRYDESDESRNAAAAASSSAVPKRFRGEALVKATLNSRATPSGIASLR